MIRLYKYKDIHLCDIYIRDNLNLGGGGNVMDHG